MNKRVSNKPGPGGARSRRTFERHLEKVSALRERRLAAVVSAELLEAERRKSVHEHEQRARAARPDREVGEGSVTQASRRRRWLVFALLAAGIAAGIAGIAAGFSMPPRGPSVCDRAVTVPYKLSERPLCVWVMRR
jgi:hypothetical protein